MIAVKAAENASSVAIARTSTASETTAAAVSGATLSTSNVVLPDGFMTSVRAYGAMGDGVTDDTAAIQAALNDGRSNASANYYGLPKALFFPAGTYLVSNTLVWNGCCVTLQGTGSSASVIRLAPASAGYGSVSIPKAIIQTPAGNTSFRQNIWDIGLSVSTGNPGAIGIDYVSNNVGSIRDVNITSDDGSGSTGVAMTRHYAGPLLIKNLAVNGFQYGITTAAYEYGATLEGISLQHQSVAGIYNRQQTISIRNLESTNSVPALINSGGVVVLLDAKLQGGTSGAQAIQSSGSIYARNVQSGGYDASLQSGSGTSSTMMTGTITEYVSGTPLTLRGGVKDASLNLPVSETPVYQDADLASWGKFTPTFYGDTKSLQALLNSGKSTIYFPFGTYYSYNETAVTVPDTVKRIIGFSSAVNVNAAGANGGGIRFIVNSSNPTPLIIEQFAYGVKVEHHGGRPVALKDGVYAYASFAGTGSLYLEDVLTGQIVIQKGQHVWARHLNNEAVGTKITNNGSLWVLGLKTENDGTAIDTSATGTTELLGNLLYPAHTVASNTPAFRAATRAVSYIYSQSSYCATCGYPIQVLETISGANMEVTSDPSRRYVMTLYHGK